MPLDVHYRRHRLGNGLEAIVLPVPERRLAVLGLFVLAGTRFESARDAGVSHFFEHMVFRGAGEFADSYALNRALESLGGPLQASTCRDSTSYLMRLDPARLAEALTLLGAMFRAPRYAGLAAEREIVLEELKAELDEDGEDLEPENLSHAMLYPHHPLCRRILGEESNIRRFAVRDLEACRQRYYVGANIVAVVSGPLDPDAVLEALEGSVGTLPTGEAAGRQAPGPGRAGAEFRIVADEDPQARVRLAFRAPPENDPGFPALKLLLRVLDDGVSSRLQNRICEELGLAYEVAAELVSYGDTSHLALELAAAPEKMPTAISELLGLLEGLVAQPPDEAELDLARRRYRLDLNSLLDDSWEMVQFLGYARLLGDTAEPEVRWREIAAVTPAAFDAVAREVLTGDRLRAVIVGGLSRRDRKACRRIVEGWKGV